MELVDLVMGLMTVFESCSNLVMVFALEESEMSIVYDMDCDVCRHSFYEGDKLRCELEFCEPDYPEYEVEDDFEMRYFENRKA